MVLRTRFSGLVYLFAAHGYALRLLFILSRLLMATGIPWPILLAELHAGSHLNPSIQYPPAKPHHTISWNGDPLMRSIGRYCLST